MGIPEAPTKKQGPKYLRRLSMAEDFISACVCISENSKAYVEQFLALSAYGDGTMNHYTPGSNGHCVGSEHPLCGCVGKPVQEAWSQWAQVVKKANLSEFERAEAVREMLGVLIAQKDKYSLTESELREAAEKALEWIYWDENNCAKARLRNSPEYKSCLDALASGNNREEAVEQFLAFECKASA